MDTCKALDDFDTIVKLPNNNVCLFKTNQKQILTVLRNKGDSSFGPKTFWQLFSALHIHAFQPENTANFLCQLLGLSSTGTVSILILYQVVKFLK